MPQEIRSRRYIADLCIGRRAKQRCTEEEKCSARTIRITKILMDNLLQLVHKPQIFSVAEDLLLNTKLGLLIKTKITLIDLSVNEKILQLERKLMDRGNYPRITKPWFHLRIQP